MHITHTLGHLRPARWRLAAAALILACCVMVALAGTASAARHPVANQVARASMPAATADTATTASLRDTSTETSSWHYIGRYFWKSDCVKAGVAGINAGSWYSYQCNYGSAFSYYELWVWR